MCKDVCVYADVYLSADHPSTYLPIYLLTYLSTDICSFVHLTSCCRCLKGRGMVVHALRSAAQFLNQLEGGAKKDEDVAAGLIHSLSSTWRLMGLCDF